MRHKLAKTRPEGLCIALRSVGKIYFLKLVYISAKLSSNAIQIVLKINCGFIIRVYYQV